jgi:hypothetical protein
MNQSRALKFVAAAAALTAAAAAQAVATTSAPSDWRLVPGQSFNGVAGAMDGVVRIAYTDAAGAASACSGSLLAGGRFVLTAAHCAADFQSMKVYVGWAGGTVSDIRQVAPSSAYINPLWHSVNDTDNGADLAILKLDRAVTSVKGYNLSATNDVGKNYLIAGYGRTGVGDSADEPNGKDVLWGHYGYNTYDVSSQTFDRKTDEAVAGWGYHPAFYAPGVTYRSDFDDGTAAHNTLGRIAGATGDGWTSGAGLGAGEALAADADSGAGEFVWNGSEWLLSGVHSWTAQGSDFCPVYGLAGCDASATNPSSFGDIAGATATFSHLAWIRAVTAVPEAQTYAMLLAGLALVGVVGRRRRANAA